MTHDGDNVAVWLLNAGDLMINRLPCHRVLVDECVKAGARSRFSIRRDACCLQNPAIVFLIVVPKTFTVRAFGVEDPRPQLSRQRVPSDSLSSTYYLFTTDNDRELPHQKVAVIHGFTREVDD